jgi:hypothetical protein
MNIRTSPRTAISAAALALLLSTSGTPAMANPAELQVPAEVTCIHLPAALSGIETKGLFKVESETRLERGPYISEREDAEGTYFRAPPGGVYLGPPKDKPAHGAWQLNRDGGIFVPRDPSAPPQLYWWVSDYRTSAATLVPPAAADCSNTSYVRDPVTKAISVAGYTGEGMTQTAAKQEGLARGGLVLGNVPGSHLGGVAGSVLGDVLDGTADMGKIAKLPQSGNPEFNAKLSQFARTAVPIKAADAPN